MKLHNKKTGEIVDLAHRGLIRSDNDDHIVIYPHNALHRYEYDSLAELNAEWEDYEEPKEYWYYDTTKNGVEKITHLEDKEKDQAIGNYFETREEAERAVKKLKAWKRLRDNGVEFSNQLYALDLNGGVCLIVYRNGYRNLDDDIDIIFGGEE